MAQDEEQKPVRFLIVDPDSSWGAKLDAEYQTLHKNAGEGAPVPVVADTVRSSQSKISDRDFAYAAIFVNPAMGSPAWFAIIRTCHQYRSGVPIFVIYDERPKISKQESAKLGVNGFIQKPIGYAKMLELVSSGGDDAESEESIDEQPQQEEKKEATGDAAIQDADVVEVDLGSMAGRIKSVFDLYVRLSNGKYVKVLKSGDILSADRIESYKAKGVTRLYILKTAQADYLSFYDTMVSDIIKDKNVSVEVKTTQVVAQGQSALQFLKNSGFSEESVQTAQQYVNNTTEVVQQISTKNDAVKNLLKDVTTYEHSMGCTTLAGLMMKHLGAQSPTIFNAIGIACFLHDIALVGQPPEILDEDESKMTVDQKVIFYAHPEEGARIVKKMKSVPPVVVTAIAQHHLRINQGGFPKENVMDEVNRIAELIGLCEEFLKLVKKAKTQPDIDPFTALRARASKEFSPQLVDAFVRTFDEK